MEQLGHFYFGQTPITNFEMETAAIYGLSRMLGHQALSTNVILANRPAGQFSPDPKKSVDQLIEYVLGKL
jgi:uridine phosphorylase